VGLHTDPDLAALQALFHAAAAWDEDAYFSQPPDMQPQRRPTPEAAHQDRPPAEASSARLTSVPTLPRPLRTA
jgi:hypothetical protein